MTKWPKDQRFNPREGLVLEEIDGDVVVLDLAHDLYFGLNAVGYVIWKRLSGGDTLELAIQATAAQFGESAERIEQDVRDFLNEVVSHNLMIPRPS